MGDALSSPKGEWDYEEDCGCEEDYEDECGCDEEDYEFDIKINLKSPTSVKQTVNDPYRKNGNDIGSFNGLANTMQGVLAAGYDRGNFNLLREYIKELVLLETTMSGVIGASALGKSYPRSGVVASTGRMGVRDGGIDHKGYVKGARTPSNLTPYVAKSAEVTKDGHQQTRHDIYFDEELEQNEDEDLSTYELFYINVKKDKNSYM